MASRLFDHIDLWVRDPAKIAAGETWAGYSATDASNPKFRDARVRPADETPSAQP